MQSIERLRGEDVRVTPTRVSADLQHGADYRSPLADLESGDGRSEADPFGSLSG